jgi:hypothetical protein
VKYRKSSLIATEDLLKAEILFLIGYHGIIILKIIICYNDNLVRNAGLYLAQNCANHPWGQDYPGTTFASDTTVLLSLTSRSVIHCMCVCMKVYMYVCVYVSVYVCKYVCMMYVCVYVCMCVCICVCMCVRMYVCTYVCVYVRMYYVCMFSSLSAEIVTSFFPYVCSRLCSYASVLKVAMQGRHCQLVASGQQ